MAADNLGVTLRALGEYQRARECHEEALDSGANWGPAGASPSR
ncbi:MAG: tetratricopeptide repeat protein [Thermomicrobiales bacterium]